jgi:dTDP-glucose 4,6-dehydratase
MQKIIVTGGLGFIGSNLIKILLQKNYYVINLDKISYASSFYNTRDYQNKKNYKFIKCNINNTKKINRILNKYKPIGVFNTAAETHVDRSIDGPKKFIQSNIFGVFNLLECFKKFSKKNKKSKFIHISTDEVYGDILNGRSKEEDAYKPSSPYAATKASSDHLVYSYIRTYKIKAIITNCSNNYGPRQHPEKLIPKLIYNIMHNKNLPIYGTGKNSREWIYVDDHCRALIKIFKNGKVGEFYNIGSNKNLRNIDIAKLLIKNAKSKIKIGSKVKIKFIKDRPGHDFRYALNSDKVMKELKWKPIIKLNIGLKKTFLWYSNNSNYYSTLKRKDIVQRLGIKK